jgi:predicted DNA-binding protein (MmcQ/YjbR family)
MNQKEATEFIAGLGDVAKDCKTKEQLILFRVAKTGSICAILHDNSSPLRLEAKCDQSLAKVLRDEYETILPSTNMDSASWNEIICSGQLDDQEIKDLLLLSYNLAIDS